MDEKNQKINLINLASLLFFIVIILIVLFFSYWHFKKFRSNILPPTTTFLTKLENIEFIPNNEYNLSFKDLLKLIKQVDPSFNINKYREDDLASFLLGADNNELTLFLYSFFHSLLNTQNLKTVSGARELALSFDVVNVDLVKIFFSDFSNLENYFHLNNLMILGVNINDILKQQRISFKPEDIFYFCDIVEPPLNLNSFNSISSHSGEVIKFTEGEIFCSHGLKMDRDHIGIWMGFLKNPSYSIKTYLVKDDTLLQIEKLSSLSMIKNFLDNNYSLIYQKNIKISQ